MTLAGHELDNPLPPGSAEWWAKMSASKVAAALGLSTWESPFSLWHKMAGSIDSPPQTPEQARGHYLESGIAAWFADQHPDWRIKNTGTWQHNERDWQIGSPDRLVAVPTDRGWEPRILECKTDAHPNGGSDPQWGEPGTDQIPVGYRVQVIWLMDVLGVKVAHVACLGSYLSFNEYVVRYNPKEAAQIRARAIRFMDSLPGGKNPQRPDIDIHDSTYAAVRALNPDIDALDEVELPEALALRYLAALDGEKHFAGEKNLTSSTVIDLMGAAKYATFRGEPIARRQRRSGGTPYLVQTGKRPALAQEEEAA